MELSSLDMLINFLSVGTGSIAIMSVVSALKSANIIHPKFAQLWSIAIGVFFGVIVMIATLGVEPMSFVVGILGGVIGGFSATGIHETSKAGKEKELPADVIEVLKELE